MTISIYDELISLEKGTSQEVKDKLVSLNLANMFKYALENYWGIFKQIVLYTAHAYSYESKLLRIGADPEKNKIEIAQVCGIPEDQYDNIIRLGDKELSQCFYNFMNLYLENLDFVHLVNLRETYQETVKLSRDSSDTKERIKMMKDAEELKDSIEQHEVKVKAHYRILNNPLKDFEHVMVDNKLQTLKLENNPLIKE